MDQHRLLEFWSSQISPGSATFLQDIKLIEASEEEHQLKSTSAKLSLPERENIFWVQKRFIQNILMVTNSLAFLMASY